jgi:hypothetical protein
MIYLGWCADIAAAVADDLCWSCAFATEHFKERGQPNRDAQLGIGDVSSFSTTMSLRRVNSTGPVILRDGDARTRLAPFSRGKRWNDEIRRLYPRGKPGCSRGGMLTLRIVKNVVNMMRYILCMSFF